MSGSLVMDGVTVSAGISSSAAGSLIVPPSTTLCYLETSGNYPLQYQNLYIYPDVYAQCNSNCKLVVCECQVNGITSGSSNITAVNTTSYWGAVNVCDFCRGGFWVQQPENCNYIFFCTDGNSASTLRVFCCSGTSGCQCCNMSYCKGTWNDGIFMNWGGSYYQSWFPGCYQACCSFKCIINPVGVSHCGPTTYSSFGLSSRVNNDFHCRLTVMYPGNSGSHIIVGFVDMTNCAFCLVYCQNETSQTDCWCGQWYTSQFNPQPFVMNDTPYVATFTAACMCVASFPAKDCRAVQNAIAMPPQFKCQKQFTITNCRVFALSHCTTSDGLVSASVEDIISNGENATVTTHFSCDTSGCFSQARCQSNTVKALYSDISSPNPANFDINPSTKFVAYGIKST